MRMVVRGRYVLVYELPCSHDEDDLRLESTGYECTECGRKVRIVQAYELKQPAKGADGT